MVKMAKFRSFMIADILSMGKDRARADDTSNQDKMTKCATSNVQNVLSTPTKRSPVNNVTFSPSKYANTQRKNSYLTKVDSSSYSPKRPEITSFLRQTSYIKERLEASRNLFPSTQERLAVPNVYISRPVALYSNHQLPYYVASGDDSRCCGVYGQRCADDSPDAFRNRLNSQDYNSIPSPIKYDARNQARFAVPIPLPVYVRTKSPPSDFSAKQKKCRRSRTVFTDLQLMGLEKKFKQHKYLSTPDRMTLADTLGLSQLQVKTWYQNRRMKWKKEVLEEGGTEAPTKPKGRPKKNSYPEMTSTQSESEDESLNVTDDRPSPLVKM